MNHLQPTIKTQTRTVAHVEPAKVDLEAMAERTQPLLDPGRFAPQTEEALERLARRYYFSMRLPDSYYPKKYDDRWTDWAIEQGVSRAYIAMLEGDAIGVGPVMAIKNIHMINNVPTMSADLMFGRMLSTRVLKRDDYTLEADKTQCKIVIGVLSRRPENRLVVTAKYEDFKHLHGKDNWRNDPEGMLVARAKSRSCKRHAPDLFVGLYSREEMNDLREDVAAGVYEVPLEMMPPAQESTEQNPTKPIVATPGTPQGEPAKPVFDREAGSALLREIRGVSETIEAASIEALHKRVLTFFNTPAYEPLIEAWNASGVLNPALVAP